MVDPQHLGCGFIVTLMTRDRRILIGTKVLGPFSDGRPDFGVVKLVKYEFIGYLQDYHMKLVDDSLRIMRKTRLEEVERRKPEGK
jgi:hypothetical protein